MDPFKRRCLIVVAFLIAVIVATSITERICGKSSEHCLSTWLHPANKDNFRVVAAEHGSDEPRDCFRFETWNQTALGDTSLSLTSFFFAAPTGFVDFNNTSLIFISLYIAITSFLFHATYGEVSRMYDILGIRLATFSIAIDAVVFTFSKASSRTFIQNAYIVVCKTSVLLIIGYVSWFQWRILPAEWHSRLLNKPEFKSTSVNIYYNLVALPFVIVAFIVQRQTLRRKPITMVSVVVFIATGTGLLIGAQNSHCPDHPQIVSMHSFGHLCIGIGLAALAALFYESGETGSYTLLRGIV